jgi:anti-sigma regulatory factor (Ser/Thr protein kinase)
VAESLSLVLVNRRVEIERLAEHVESFGNAHHLPADDIHDVNLVLDEIVINIIKHGYDDDREHEIHVRLEIEAGEVTITVEDDGRPFNPLDAPAPNLDLPIEERPIGGLGIHIVRSLVDRIEYERAEGRNRLTLRKRARTA